MQNLPDLPSNRLALLILDEHASLRLPVLIARLALTAPLRVVDAGNCFAAYPIAREIRRLASNPFPALERIQVARAFTCYQVLTLLEETPSGPAPLLVLNLLSTFYDENVRLVERQRLLQRCLQELHRLKHLASVGVIVPLHRKTPAPLILLALLEDAADQVWRLASPSSDPPSRFF